MSKTGVVVVVVFTESTFNANQKSQFINFVLK